MDASEAPGVGGIFASIRVIAYTVFLTPRRAPFRNRRHDSNRFFSSQTLFRLSQGLTPRTAAKLYLTDHQNGIYTIGYKPTLNGDYLLKIRMCGMDLPSTPLRIHAQN